MRIDWQQFFTKKRISLSPDPSLAWPDRMPSLYHLCHHHHFHEGQLLYFCIRGPIVEAPMVSEMFWKATTTSTQNFAFQQRPEKKFSNFETRKKDARFFFVFPVCFEFETRSSKITIWIWHETYLDVSNAEDSCSNRDSHRLRFLTKSLRIWSIRMRGNYQSVSF